MLQLPAGEVHLWLSRYDHIDDPRVLDTCRDMLTAEERAQTARFHFPDDRRRHLVTRALLRSTLSLYADADASAWRFVSNAYGRPALAQSHGDACALSFNLSHTRHLIALAITRGVAIGVDVENHAAREAPLDIAGHFFSHDEAAELATIAPAQRQRRFYEYWTLKEAYIKARGMGLSLPLDKFTFHYPCERGIGLALQPELGDDATRWRLWQLQPEPDYLLAMCVERQAGAEARLVVQPASQVLANTEAASCRLLRESR